MKKLHLIFYGFIILITFVISAMFAYFVIEPKCYDFMIKNVTVNKLSFDKNKQVYGHDDVVLVIVDEKSIEKYRWPWKRNLQNKVIKYFQEYAKPKILIHDTIVIAEDAENPQSDEEYFNTVKNYDKLVEGFLLNANSYKDKALGKEFDKIYQEKYGLKNIEVNTELPMLYESIMVSPKPYLEALKHGGAVNLMPGFFDIGIARVLGDETFRMNEYLINYKGSVLTSMPFCSFLAVNNYPKIVISKNYIEFPELNYKIKYMRAPFYIFVPIKFYKMYPTGYSHKHYSAVDIMNSYDNLKSGKKPIVNPEIFKDKIIVYGANVSAGNGLNDNRKSPVVINHPGADIQATTIDNIFHNDYLKMMPFGVNVLITLLAMFCTYYSIKKYPLLKAVNCSLSVILIFFLCALICYYNDIVIAVITPIILCIYTILVTYVNRYVIEEKNKQKVTSALGKYMSEDVMKDVIKNIDNLGLGGKKAVVTVLFSDIRGFTSMSEKMTAQEVSQFLTEYFSEMEPIVTKYNGIVNKYIGDAVMAVFGEPIQDNNHPKNAVRCGFEMLNKVKELDEKWQKEGKPSIKIGVGINTGDVFVGNIGSEKRMEYTVIGDTVNLASRLESYNKIYKTEMLISSSTYELSKDIAEVSEITDVEIRGKAEKMSIYAVINVI